MKISYIRKKTYTQFLLNNLDKAKGSDLLIFGDGCFNDVCLEDELDKKSSEVFDICILSSLTKSALLVKCKTSLDGVSRNSVLIAESGKLLGICDEIDFKDTKQSASVNLYEIGGIRICVIVEDNTSKIEFMQIAQVFECQLVVLISGENSSKALTSLARYELEENGLSSLICSKNKLEVFIKDSIITHGKNIDIIKFTPKKCRKTEKFCKHLHKTIYTNIS